MKYLVIIALTTGIMAVFGCTAEKVPEQTQKIPTFTLSLADKEKLMAFQKDILSIETLTDKAVKLAGDELKNVIKGGAVSMNIPAIVDKAKAECLLAGEALAKKKVPEALPPELKVLLNEGKAGLIAANTAYAESFDAIRSFVGDKNPMALLEYRKKSLHAQELFTSAADKFKTIMAAAGAVQ